MIAKQNTIESCEGIARTIAELGLVTRDRDRFEVTVPETVGEPDSFYVWRADDGRVCCTCAEASAADDSDFRCCHMMAVRFAIKSRNTERTAKRLKSRSTAAANSGNVVDFATGRQRSGNASRIESAAAATELLRVLDPHWSHAVRDVREVGKFVVVTVAVTVNGVTREGIGTGVLDEENGFVSAESYALRQAAAKFRSADESRTESARPLVRVFPSNPIARSLFDLVTAKQLGMIRAMGRELGLKADDECRRVMNCSTDELSKRAASALIEHFDELRRIRPAQAERMRLAG